MKYAMKYKKKRIQLTKCPEAITLSEAFFIY